jgi:hypothetical protein
LYSHNTVIQSKNTNGNPVRRGLPAETLFVCPGDSEALNAIARVR